MLLAAFLFFGLVSANAQEKVIDASAFEAVYNTGAHPNVRWKGQSFRTIIATEFRNDLGQAAATNWGSKLTTENGPSQKVRMIRESSFGGKVNEKQESIIVNGIRYSRIGSGNWTQQAEEASPKAQDLSHADPSHIEYAEMDVEYKSLGTESYKEQIARTYLKTERKKGIMKSSGAEYSSVATTKYWFSSDGTMLKSEFRVNSRSGETNSYTGVFMEWERDPTIVITAPAVP